MNSLELRSFWLSGDWHPLLSRLPGWSQAEDDLWTDGDSEIRLTDSAYAGPRLGFRLTGAERSCEPSDILASPAGCPILLYRKGRAPSPGRPLLMNHAAWNAADLATESAWLTTQLGTPPVLSRDVVWEPVSGRFLSDCHFFHPAGFYITLRSAPNFQLDHVGWMADSPATVDAVSAEIRAIGWSIVWGPGGIDGSYLVHFRGPDGLVHDFFAPSAALLEMQSRLPR